MYKLIFQTNIAKGLQEFEIKFSCVSFMREVFFRFVERTGLDTTTQAWLVNCETGAILLKF